MKNKIITTLAISLSIILWLYFTKEETIKTVTKTEIKYDTITNTIDNTKPNKITRITIRVADTVKENDTITKIIYKDKLVNRFQYTDVFENGIVDSDIVADTIYQRNVKLTTFNKTETTTVTNTLFKSSLYVGGMLTSDFNKSISNVSINAYYTHRNKFLLTTGLGYGIDTDKPTVNVGLAFRF